VPSAAGQLYAFGDNAYGGLGSTINNGNFTANPTPVLVSLPGASGPVIQIAAGAAHTLATTSTGQLYAFGDNNSGQLGSATNSGSSVANPTPALVSLPGASGPVTQIAAGGYHSLAVTSTGQLYAFGDNYAGELASTTNNGTLTANPTPTVVSLPGASGPVTQIAAGASHSLAVTSTGQLYAFGDNSDGELGGAANSGNTNPNPTPALVSLPGASGPVTQIAAGNGYSLAVTSGGQLYAFGLNQFGQLGSASNNGTTNANPTPALVGLPAGTTIDTVARGPEASRTLALVADLAVANGSLPPGRVGVSYSTTAQASGGVAPYRWSASGLPTGLSIDPASGQITGTSATPERANIVLTVTDGDGITATSATLRLTIGRAPPPTPTAAQLKASLLAQLAPTGKGAKLAMLVKRRRYALPFDARRAGVVVIDWYYPSRGAHPPSGNARRVLVAAGRRTFVAAGARAITVKLTAKGTLLLKHARRIRLSAKGTFTARGTRGVIVTKSFTLTR
jgi:hypothetical protein